MTKKLKKNPKRAKKLQNMLKNFSLSSDITKIRIKIKRIKKRKLVLFNKINLKKIDDE